MRNSKFLIIFLTAILPIKLLAQNPSLKDVDITGLWKGTLYNDTTQRFYKYEIGISEEKGKLSGFSHTFFLVEDKEFYGVKKVKVKRTGGKIIVEDAGLIANNYPESPAKGVRQLNVLTLEIKDSIMTLTGPYSTNRTKEYSSLTGTVSLQRKNNFRQSALVPHLQELGRSNELSFVKKENDRIKEEEEKRKAEKDLAIKKEKAITEESLAKDQASPKEQAINPTVSKEIVSKTSKEVKGSEPEEKTVTANKGTSKTEPSKKETPETKSTAKEISSKEQSRKEIKPGESKKADSNSITKEQQKESRIVAVRSNAPAADVATRQNIVQQTVFFSSDSLQISLYDNGEVDGDTVSVLMNGKIIMAKEGLSTNAVRKTIYTSHDTDSIELVMYAENLGAIAPNTGLLVVHDGKSIYEIRFSGDLQKNASIILRRRKN